MLFFSDSADRPEQQGPYSETCKPTYNDAKQVCSKLIHHASKFVKAVVNSAVLRLCITSVRLRDGTWKGGTIAFVLIELAESAVEA
jgi:hypothetical protein